MLAPLNKGNWYVNIALTDVTYKDVTGRILFHESGKKDERGGSLLVCAIIDKDSRWEVSLWWDSIVAFFQKSALSTRCKVQRMVSFKLFEY